LLGFKKRDWGLGTRKKFCSFAVIQQWMISPFGGIAVKLRYINDININHIGKHKIIIF
jgi:hypothetical protein